MTSIEKDTIARNRIVSETNTNLFVEAGAGSGKTTMLVSRMVAMVEAGMDIGKICAITFTKAAAGEFYERFQEKLIERSNPDYKWVDKKYAGQLPAPTDITRARCEEALKNIDLCFMGTIDSFCSMVLSEHPSEARIPSDSSILSNEEAMTLYNQIFVRISDGEFGDELREQSKIFRNLHYKAAEVFMNCESIFMGSRNVKYKYKTPLLLDIDSAFANDRIAINAALKCLLEHPELKYSGSNKKNDEAWEVLPKVARKLAGRWSSNFTAVISGIKSLKELRINSDIPESFVPVLGDLFELAGSKKSWREFVPAQDGGLFDRINDYRYEISMDFLIKCVPVIEQVMRDKGAMTFFDYLYYLRDMLKRDAADGGKLIRYIYDRHSYFLIDEFQDTNPMQAEVFFYLASENPVEKWSDCVPRPGSLFIVGDPKQSIYRFRSADVTSFLKVKKLFEEKCGDVLYLSRNFRSTKTLCAYFNRVFGELLPEETSVQSKFAEIPVPDSEKEEYKGIYKYEAFIDSTMVEDPEDSNANCICRIINKLVNNDEYKIYKGSDENAKLEKLDYDDIMIITSGKKAIDPIVRELEQSGIPMKVEGRVPFARNRALIEIYNIYLAVACPDDQQALYSALKGLMYCTSDEELMKFRLAGGVISLKTDNVFEGDAEDVVLKVAERINELKALEKRARKLSPAALFAEIMDGFKVYRVVEADNLEVLYYTLELMRNAEKSGKVISLSDGAMYISELLVDDSKEERCLSLNGNKSVHIANLHKVKGLEAPVVILSAGIGYVPPVKSRVVHGDNGSEGYIFKMTPMEGDARFSYFETAAYSDAETDEKEASEAEQKRLIYVAATRARNTLIICDSILNGKYGPYHRSMWTPLFEASTQDFFEVNKNIANGKKKKRDSIDVMPLYEKAEKESILKDRTCEASTYRLENPSKTRITSKLAEQVDEDSIVIPDNVISSVDENESIVAETENRQVAEVHRFPALLGTMTHRLMEVLVSSKDTADVDGLVDEIIREYRTPKNIPYESKLSEALKAVAKTMHEGGYAQNNKAPQDILKTLLEADEVYCEVPFCYKDIVDGETIVWNGIMDVVYCKDRLWHIIDYKTNVDGSDLDHKYNAQMQAYIKAFKASTGENADAMTYHIDI